ncbi:MAG: outer membrane beta-barrel protein [Xanthomonadales bacterium]|nr:outer membrane beta-barrel protein [Xanthomonadales bacterium]
MPANSWIISGVLVTALCTSGSLVAAEQPGFYGQVDLGQAHIDESLDSNGTFFDLDDSASSWRVALGYSWNPWVAIEAGYADFGAVSATFPGLSVAAEAHGLELGLVFRWPLTNKFGLSGRAGYLWWDAETQVSSLRDSDSGSEVFAGVGAEYQASDRLAVTAGWTRYQLDNLDVDQASLGLRWQFGNRD